MLRTQNAVHGMERKLTAAIEEVGQVGLVESGLAGEQRHTQGAPLNSADQFHAEPFVHLGHIHVWKVNREQWRGWVSNFFLQYKLDAIVRKQETKYRNDEKLLRTNG